MKRTLGGLLIALLPASAGVARTAPLLVLVLVQAACMSLDLRACGGTLSPAYPEWDGVRLARVEPDGTAVLQWQGQEIRAVPGNGVPGISGLSVRATDCAAQTAQFYFKGCYLPSEQ